MRRRLGRLEITYSLLEALLFSGEERIATTISLTCSLYPNRLWLVDQGKPEYTAKIAWTDDCPEKHEVFAVIFEHPQIPEVGEGDIIPMFDCMVTMVEKEDGNGE